MAKILMALSGGVDSAVAARLLLELGHTLEAAFLSHPALDPSPAMRAADELGIPLHLVDISEPLERIVMRDFEAAYLSGRTPNPCVVCNPSVKFAELIRLADDIGCERVATGHYCRLDRPAPGRTKLLRSLTPNDQSYMLCRLRPEQLERCVFPLGGLDKGEIRALAAQYGLSSADKPDSMEICFIPDGDYASWLRSRGIESAAGDFVDEQGSVLGRHGGIIGYTVGQRRGLGVSAAERLYVKRIDVNTNSIILCTENEMYTDTVHLTDLLGVSRELSELPGELSVRVRHSRVEYPAHIGLSDGGAVLKLGERIKRPAAGQFAALYVGEELAASGIIT